MNFILRFQRSIRVTAPVECVNEMFPMTGNMWSAVCCCSRQDLWWYTSAQRTRRRTFVQDEWIWLDTLLWRLRLHRSNSVLPAASFRLANWSNYRTVLLEVMREGNKCFVVIWISYQRVLHCKSEIWNSHDPKMTENNNEFIIETINGGATFPNPVGVSFRRIFTLWRLCRHPLWRKKNQSRLFPPDNRLDLKLWPMICLWIRFLLGSRSPVLLTVGPRLLDAWPFHNNWNRSLRAKSNMKINEMARRRAGPQGQRLGIEQVSVHERVRRTPISIQNSSTRTLRDHYGSLGVIAGP